MGRVRTVKTEYTRIKDENGKTVTELEQTSSSSVKQQDIIFFTKVFKEDLGHLYNVSKGGILVFMEIALQLKGKERHFYMSPMERGEITKRTGLSQQSIYNCLAELCKAGLLVRVVRGVFSVNPFLFATGTDLHVLENRKAFRMELNTSYGIDDDGVMTDKRVQIKTFVGATL